MFDPTTLSGRRLRALGPLLIPVGLALFVFRGPLFLGELPFHRDMSLLFVPLKRFLGEALRSGRLPEWWPWDALGMPLVSVPVLSTFHPSTLLFLLLPFQAAFVLQLVLPVPVALLGTWRLGRALGLRPVFATLAATGFVLGGYFLCLTEFTSMSLAAAALPWLWWGALGDRRGRWGRTLVLTLALASMLLAGDPQLALMGVLACAGLLVRRTSPRRLVRPALSLGLGTVLAVGLAAVQLVPSVLLLHESPRATGQGIVGADYWRLDLPQFLGLVAPSAFPSGNFLFQRTYLGLGLGALALVGAGVRGRARGRLGTIALVSLVLALGSLTPLWALFSAVVPFWKSFQFPMKASGPALLVLPLLAARGAQLGLGTGRRRVLPAAVCALAAVGGALGGEGAPVLFCGLLAGVLALVAWRARLRPLLLPLLLVAVGLDLAAVNGPVVATVSPDFYSPPPLAQVLRRGGVSAEGFSYLSLWHPAPRFEDPALLDVAQNAALRPIRGALHGLPTCNPYLQGFSARYTELVLGHPQKWIDTLAGAYGTRFIIASLFDARPGQRERALAVDEPSDSMVLPIPRFLPRAYVVQGVKVLPRAQVLDYLGSDFHPGQEVVLEAEAAGEAWAHAPGGPARGVEHLRRRGDAVEIETTLEAPGMLVLNESYYPGVEASEEGRPLPVFPANHAVRAVPLSAGHHVVRFEYHTPGLVLGALTSAAVALGLLLAGGLHARKRRGRKAEA